MSDGLTAPPMIETRNVSYGAMRHRFEPAVSPSMSVVAPKATELGSHLPDDRCETVADSAERGRGGIGVYICREASLVSLAERKRSS